MCPARGSRPAGWRGRGGLCWHGKAIKVLRATGISSCSPIPSLTSGLKQKAWEDPRRSPPDPGCPSASGSPPGTGRSEGRPGGQVGPHGSAASRVPCGDRRKRSDLEGQLKELRSRPPTADGAGSAAGSLHTDRRTEVHACGSVCDFPREAFSPAAVPPPTPGDPRPLAVRELSKPRWHRSGPER